MDTETATNPVEGEDTAAATLPETQEVEAAAEELEPARDEDGSPIEEPPSDDSEEIELDGLKFTVPKAAKDAFLRQADYTRKTQDLAQARKAFEAERQAIAGTTQKELDAFAEARSIEAQIAQFQRVDWNAWNDTDPPEAQKAFMRYQQLKDGYSAALGQLSGLRNQRLSVAQQETAQRIEQGREALIREIGWNDDLKARLTGFAAEYGFSADDLSDLEADPRVAKVLHAAFEGREVSRKHASASRHVQAQKVEPAATVGAKAAPPSGLDDRLSTDEWMRRRNAQLRRK